MSHTETAFPLHEQTIQAGTSRTNHNRHFIDFFCLKIEDYDEGEWFLICEFVCDTPIPDHEVRIVVTPPEPKKNLYKSALLPLTWERSPTGGDVRFVKGTAHVKLSGAPVWITLQWRSHNGKGVSMGPAYLHLEKKKTCQE